MKYMLTILFLSLLSATAIRSIQSILTDVATDDIFVQSQKLSVTPPAKLNLTGIIAVSKDELWAIGNEIRTGRTPQGKATIISNSLLMVSQNGGQSWETRLILSDTFFSQIYLLNSGDAWILGDHGLAIRSQDGGRIWKPQNIPIESLLIDLQFVSASRGWILSVDGTMIQTQDKGEKWVPCTSDSEYKFASFTFKDEANGWAIAKNGTLYQTTNGGNTWQSRTADYRKIMNIPDEKDLVFQSIKAVNTKEIFFFAESRSKGEIIAKETIMFQSKDGGETWRSKRVSPTKGVLRAYIVNEKDIWIVPRERYTDYLLRTTDGWKTFEEVKLPTECNPNSFYFLNSQVSWFIRSTDDFSSTSIFSTIDGWKTSKRITIQ